MQLDITNIQPIAGGRKQVIWPVNQFKAKHSGVKFPCFLQPFGGYTNMDMVGTDKFNHYSSSAKVST